MGGARLTSSALYGEADSDLEESILRERLSL
jgi:hypothetical protein